MKKIEVQGGYEKGGYEFNVIETPEKLTYKIESIKEFKIRKDTYWHGYIKGKEIKKKKFPLDANPRKPGPTKVVKIMQATIQKEPENFHHLNNGMTIISKSLDFDQQSSSVTVEFGTSSGIHGDGVCNGGHTYFAIEQFSGVVEDEMLVKVEILVLDPSLSPEERAEKIKVIAEARNSHNELESITTAHYSGYYDGFISTLGSKKVYFKWYEGDPDALKNSEKVDSLIAKLTAICPHWYSHYLNSSGNNGNHMSSARNTGSTHKKWENYKINDADERNLDYMLPLLDDILLLRDEISWSLLHDDFYKVSKRWRSNRLWQYLSSKKDIELKFKRVDGKKVKGYDLSHTFITMILGAFRENVWFSVGDDGINLVGWLEDPIKLWQSHKEILLGKLNNIALTINAPSFGNAFLQNPALYNEQLTFYSHGVNVQNQVTKPEIIYDVQSGEKYIIDESNNSDLVLTCQIIDEDVPPFAEIVVDSSAQGQKYLKFEYEE